MSDRQPIMHSSGPPLGGQVLDRRGWLRRATAPEPTKHRSSKNGTGGDSGGLKAVVMAVVFSLLPLACIWFPDEMGSLAYMRGLPLNQTPGGLVIAGGWLVLLLPIAVALIFFLRSG